ncbi:MAG TPA: TolC family protein, partial [Acidobacteriaceae bacterium]|nr:TolC family protein [Acidobacteriaceae bacterium]
MLQRSWSVSMKVMGRRFLLNLLLGLLLPGGLSARAQPAESYRKFMTPEVASGKLSPPRHIAEYEKDGSLSISLSDAVRLALANNSNIHIQETQIEAQKFVLLGAHQPFDPLLQTIGNVSRYSTPGTSELQGVGQASTAQNSLTQSGQINYSELFKTGTSIVGAISSTKNSTNDSFDFFNPYYNSLLSFQFTQPLLRGAGVFANTAALVIARRNLEQTRASFAGEVNDAIFQVVVQYWAVVQARENLEVEQQSLSLAESSYQRDKRALELGALPPLDIYRSQAEVASRKLQAIQGEYTLKQVEEDLRLTIGADQDPAIHVLTLDLTEKPAPQGELASIQMQDALASALAGRPEVAV